LGRRGRRRDDVEDEKRKDENVGGKERERIKKKRMNEEK
jgi:hypothetical protein